MDYYPYTLLDALEQSSAYRLSEPMARRYFVQILQGLSVMHERGIVHKDIKVENILLNRKKTRCALADFGFARPFTKHQLMSDRSGSLHYSAPELWMGWEHYGPTVDVFALGVTLYVLLTGYFPFGGTTPQEIFSAIQSDEIWMPQHLSKHAKQLLHDMLAFWPEHRITLREIYKTPWVSLYKNKIRPYGKIHHRRPKKKAPLHPTGFSLRPIATYKLNCNSLVTFPDHGDDEPTSSQPKVGTSQNVKKMNPNDASPIEGRKRRRRHKRSKTKRRSRGKRVRTVWRKVQRPKRKGVHRVKVHQVKKFGIHQVKKVGVQHQVNHQVKMIQV